VTKEHEEREVLMMFLDIHRLSTNLYHFRPTFSHFKNEYCLLVPCMFYSTIERLSVYFLLFRKYGFDLVKVNETHYGILSL